MTKILDRGDVTALASLVDCLMEGGVAVVPTDTVYGLAVLPSQAPSVQRLFAIKARPANVNLPVMVASVEQLQLLGAELSNNAQKLLTSCFIPGALSLVLGVKPGATPDWLNGRDEIAVRIPDDPFLLEVIGQTGPILATSANRHGNPTPDNVADVLAQLELSPDLAINGGKVATIPSTLVNCRVDPPIIERSGVVSAEEVGGVIHG